MNTKVKPVNKKVDVLRRLNKNDLELCTNFGVDAPKPGSKDKFYVSLVVRPELVDTPVTVILKKGIRAKEAIDALLYVADIIHDANKAASNARGMERIAKLGWPVRFAIRTGAVLMVLFHLPGDVLQWLKDKALGL